jgi:hypothetical protein
MYGNGYRTFGKITSGIQNIRATKCPGAKHPDAKHPATKCLEVFDLVRLG